MAMLILATWFPVAPCRYLLPFVHRCLNSPDACSNGLFLVAVGLMKCLSYKIPQSLQSTMPQAASAKALSPDAVLARLAYLTLGNPGNPPFS